MDENKKSKTGTKKTKFDKAKEFNKYAMEKGISPNFDSIRKADGYMAESEAMKNFYSKPENVKKMNEGQKNYFKGPSKALVGDQHKLPDHLKAKIEAAPGMFGKKENQKGYIKNSTTGDGAIYDQKKEVKTLKGGRKNKYYKDGKKVAVAKDRISGVGKNKRYTGSTIDIKSPGMVDMDAPGFYNKSKSKVEQDYARNAIADYKAGDKKQANYEKKKELEVAAGEGYFHSGNKITKHSKNNRS
jgi:hypothetical protein